MSEFDCPVYGLTHGTQQSPIDIQRRQTFKAELPPIAFTYASPIKGVFKKNAWDEEHPFFSIAKSTPSTILFGSSRAELKQIHFHSPSEHHIEGKSQYSEFHFVHEITGPKEGEADFDRREPSTKIVIGVFAERSSCKEMEKADEQVVLQQYKSFSQLFTSFGESGSGGEQSQEVDFPEEFIKEMQNIADEFFHYRGSLTTGTFAEVVTWLVLPKPVAIHVCLPEAIEKAEQHTRSLQPLNRRSILFRGHK